MISLLSRILIVMFIVSLPISSLLFSQTRTADPEWWYGGAGGANFNYFGGTVQKLNASTTSLAPFTRGAGAGLFLAPLIEFHPDPVWGGMLAVGFDSRSGSWDDV